MSDTIDSLAIREQAFRDAVAMCKKFRHELAQSDEEAIGALNCAILLSEAANALAAERATTPPKTETEAEARARVARGVANLLDPSTVAEQLGGGNG